MNMINKTYKLSEVARSKIAADLRGKAGIYQWIHSINGKSYIGSSSNLRRRFLEYLNPNRLNRELERGESIIYKALLKYGYLSFELKILEIVELDTNLTTDEQSLSLLEQKYIDSIKPAYKILAFAGTNRGHKLSSETKVKMSLSKKGQKSNRKGSSHSTESKNLMKENSGRKIQVHVYNPELVLLNSFNSITECSKETKINYLVIWRALLSKKLVENKYYFSKDQLNQSNTLK